MKGIYFMDYSKQLALSYYKTIATLNEEHKIFLVQHQDTQEIFVKKILSIYNTDIYNALSEHPVCGTPQIIDYFEEENHLTLIEAYISGQSLERVLQTNHPDIMTILHYIIELCEILCRLHNMQPPVIHRDIKPSNIIITEYDHVVLLDFNAAKHYSDSSSCDTVLLGTKGYAAPEQYGFGSSSPKTDIYAVGILLKELTSPLSDVPQDIETIIEKCIELNPADRYDSVAELKIALENISQKEVTAPETSPSEVTNSEDTLTDANANQDKKAAFKPSFSYRELLFPGFRTGTIWKMLLATPTYFFVFALSFSLTVENTYGAKLWIQRLFFLLMLLSVIFATCNYMNIQKFFPLCKSRYRILRYLGIILFDFTLLVLLMLLMVTILLFFP